MESNDARAAAMQSAVAEGAAVAEERTPQRAQQRAQPKAQAAGGIGLQRYNCEQRGHLQRDWD